MKEKKTEIISMSAGGKMRMLQNKQANKQTLTRLEHSELMKFSNDYFEKKASRNPSK